MYSHIMAVLLRTLVVASLALMVSAAAIAKLPKDFKRCKKHDPALNECLREAIQKAIISLRKGAPSLGVMTIDPLRVTQLRIDQGSGPVSIKLDFSDLDIKGLGSVKLDRVNVDWDKYYIEAEGAVIDPVVLQGPYKINGKVLILPITGQGLSNITEENVKAKFQIYGKPLKKNGVEYMDVEKITITFTTTRMRLNLSNLFNGDKALGDNMNRFLNENWQEILNELKPSIEEALGLTFKEIANRIFHRVPLNQIFLN